MDVKNFINELGGATKVAEIVGISSQAVSQWKKVPANHVVDLCKEINNKFKPNEVRPDIFS